MEVKRTWDCTIFCNQLRIHNITYHCHPSIRGQVRALFPSVRLILPFFVGDIYSSSLQVCYKLWNLPVFKIYFFFRQTSHNFPYVCCIFAASFPTLASHSSERAHSSQGHRAIRISSIVMCCPRYYSPS